MKNFLQKIKAILIIVLWLSCGSVVVILLGASLLKKQDSPFQKIEVRIEESDGHLFIDRSDVLQLLKNHRISEEHPKPVSDISFNALEKMIESNPYVSNATVYVDANDKIRITVAQRLPLIRIINNQLVSYYIDDRGRRMPCSPKFTARVPVATGFIFTNADQHRYADSLIEQKLFLLADFIRRDTFLSALTEQIVVNEHQEFELIPLVGNHSILIGDVDDLDRKFSNLKSFYNGAIRHHQLDQYSLINIKFSNQVYCTRKSEYTRNTLKASQ